MKGVDRIEILSLTPRVCNALHSEGIHTVSDLLARDGWVLLDIKSFGVKALTEVRDALGRHGLALKDPTHATPLVITG